MEHTRHILFVTEKNTALATFVAVYSLRLHRDASQKYQVHILSIGLTHEQECALQALSEETLTVHVYGVDSQKEETTPQDIAGILTLQLANIFWELSTALYLDAHVIIQKDMKPLFVAREHMDENLAHVAWGQEDVVPRQTKVMLLHLEAMREHQVVAELMACNVAKGDHAGYGRALQTVLGQKNMYFPQGAVAVETADGLLSAQEACICVCTSHVEAQDAGGQNSLWHRYNAKACADFAPMHAVFTAL